MFIFCIIILFIHSFIQSVIPPCSWHSCVRDIVPWAEFNIICWTMFTTSQKTRHKNICLVNKSLGCESISTGLIRHVTVLPDILKCFHSAQWYQLFLLLSPVYFIKSLILQRSSSKSIAGLVTFVSFACKVVDLVLIGQDGEVLCGMEVSNVCVCVSSC